MDYENMKDAAIKNLLIDVMKEREGLHYTLGWLRHGYCHPSTPEIDRAVAIKQLKGFQMECDK